MRKFTQLIYLLIFTLCFEEIQAQTLTNSNLPIIIIQMDNNAAIVDDPKRLGTMKILYRGVGQRNYLSDTSTTAYLNYNGRIGIELRGSSSQWSSNLGKFSYGFETYKADLTNNNVSLLGMPSENDWILNAFVYDKTLIRNIFTAEVSNLIGRKSQRSRPCEVILNGNYIGVYFLMEKIKQDKERTDIEELLTTDSAGINLTGGYMYKIDKPTGTNNTSWTSVNGFSRYQYHEPNESTITTAQKNYIKNEVNRLESAMNGASSTWSNTSSGYPDVIDVMSFIDQHIMHEMAGNIDMLASSMYYSKDRGGKIVSGPIWDHDLGYGNLSSYDAERTDVFFTNRGQSVADGPSYFQKLMFQDMNYRCRLAKRWQELRGSSGILNTTKLLNLIDTLAEPMRESNSREQSKWSTLGRNYFSSPSGWQNRTTYQSELNYMKNWLNSRLTWLDNNIAYSGTCTLDSAPLLVINEIMYNPVGNGASNSDRLYEYIEIKNISSQPVPLQGIFFSSGVSYKFNSGTIQPSQIIVLASDSLGFVQRYGFSPYGKYYRNLSNSSAAIVLHTAKGAFIDSVSYGDKSPWPTSADGGGMSLELSNTNLNNNLSTSWFARSIPGGTPGRENDQLAIPQCGNTVPQIAINEIFYNGGGGITPGDWIELYNPSNSAVNLSNWKLFHGLTDSFQFTSISIPSKGFIVISNDSSKYVSTYPNLQGLIAPYFNFSISNNALLSLRSPTGCEVDRVEYSAVSPWPSEPNGLGNSLMLKDSSLNNAIPSSWKASINKGGSPGVSNNFSPPAANFAFNPTVNNTIPATVSFSASSSTDNQSIIKYEWNLGDGRIDTGRTLTKNYSTEGMFKVTLKVADNEGNIDAIQKDLIIGNLSPKADFTLSPQFISKNSSVNFDASISTAVANKSIVNYSWNFGDGTSIDTGMTKSHTYANSGSYIVTLTVTDNFGSTNLHKDIVYVNGLKEEVLIAKKQEWQYLDSGYNLNATNPQWKSVITLTNPWKKGNAELGYGDGDETTTLSYGGNANNKYITSYFRKTFNVPDPNKFVSFILNLKRDDGAIVYINGNEIRRDNLPSGAITSTTLATTAIANGDESTFFTTSITNNYFVAGENLVAVELHQNALNSSDISFDLELIGNYYNNYCAASNSNVIINEINYNSPDTSNAGDWVELYNSLPTSMDVSNWGFQDDNHTFVIPSGTTIPAQGYLIISADTSKFKLIHPNVQFLKDVSGFDFSNGGEKLKLLNTIGCTMDSVLYDDVSPWPISPDGKGYSLSLKSTNLDNAVAANWEESPLRKGTPGMPNILPTYVSGIELVYDTSRMTINESRTITANILPTNATNKAILWRSSDTSIATVNNSGVVTAKSANSFSIIATTVDGNFADTAYLTAIAIPVSGIALTPSSLSLQVGTSQPLTANISPSNATNKSVVWTSSNNAIASVSSSGIITGIATGNANIYARSQDGNYTASVSITVIDVGANPLIHLKFNEGTGTSVSNSGTLGGSLTKTAIPSWSSNVPGNSNSGTFSIDYGNTAGNNYVESNAPISQLAGLTSFTITGWVNNRNSTTGSGGNRIVSWINHGANGVDLVYRSNGSLALGIDQWPDNLPGSKPNKITTDANTNSSNWRFFAVTYSGTQVKYYFGSSSTNLTLDTTLNYNRGPVDNNISRLSIGNFNIATRNTSYLDRYFRGLIDDIRIYGTVLNAQELQIIKNTAVVPISITGIELVYDTSRMTVNESRTITANILPTNATNKAINWRSSDTSIATVNTSGVVTAKSANSFNIIATTVDGNFADTAYFTAIAIPVSGIALTPSSLSLQVGTSQPLTATISPSNATNKSVVWTSSNNAIASVSSSGIVTGIATGNANIYATSQDGNYTANVSITVIDAGENPLIHLKFNEGTGTSVSNSGTLGGSLTKTAIPSWSSNVPANSNSGTFSIDFGNTAGNNYVESNAPISQLAGLTSFTITGWVNNRNSTTGSGGNRIVSWINHGANGVDLVYRSDGSLALSVDQWPDNLPGSNPNKITTDANTNSSNWRFFAVTYSGTQVKYYFGSSSINLTLDTTLNYNRGAVDSNISRLSIGNFNIATRGTSFYDRYFRGLMDDIRIYGTNLSESQLINIQTSSSKLVSSDIVESDLIHSFDIHPNPTTGNYSVSFHSVPNQSEGTEIILTDILGRTILNEKVRVKQGQNIYNFDASQVPNGTYRVILNTSDKSFAKQLIIHH